MNKEKDYLKVIKLNDGEQTTVFWHEEGGGVVLRVDDKLFVYEVPQYGGEPTLGGVFSVDHYKSAVDLAWTWT